jgi:hypothetical protein
MSLAVSEVVAQSVAHEQPLQTLGSVLSPSVQIRQPVLPWRVAKKRFGALVTPAQPAGAFAWTSAAPAQT